MALKLKDRRLDLFAATPPLESLRFLYSLFASRQERSQPFRMLRVDVRRAYFYAAAKRNIYNGIPFEDWEDGDENRVAQLDLSFYGTRDAIQNWTEEYTKTLRDMGFTVGIASPCNFVYPDKELYVSVHGDDFTIVGPAKEFEWMRSKLAKAIR